MTSPMGEVYPALMVQTEVIRQIQWFCHSDTCIGHVFTSPAESGTAWTKLELLWVSNDTWKPVKRVDSCSES